MFRIEGRLTGVAAILFSHWTTTSEESIRTGATGGKFTDEQRMLEAMQKLYRDEDGLYVPSLNFKKALLDGCRAAGLKEGKKSMEPFLKATVFVEEHPRFNRTEPDFIHEATGKRPPRTGGACLIKRPALKAGWELSFVMNVLDDRRNRDAIRRALEEAGMLVGLGSWRPEYGRFIVSEWAVRELVAK